MATTSPAYEGRFAVRASRPGVLADILPGGRVRDLVLVVGYAGLVGLLAQMVIPLPFTPVPITGQTFAVMVGAAALGWRRALNGMVLYIVAGLAGVPWFAEQTGGITAVTSATFGYILGFMVASMVLGGLANRRWDRTVPRAAAMFGAGMLIVYGFGLPWLMATLQVGLLEGLAKGLVPFLLGDALKILLAAGLVSGTWTLLRRIA